MPEHPIPATLEEWLTGWQVGKKGNPWRKCGEDVYVVFRRKHGTVWGASIGKTFGTISYRDAEEAKRGLYQAITKMSQGQLDRIHAGPQNQPARR